MVIFGFSFGRAPFLVEVDLGYFAPPPGYFSLRVCPRRARLLCRGLEVVAGGRQNENVEQ